MCYISFYFKVTVLSSTLRHQTVDSTDACDTNVNLPKRTTKSSLRRKENPHQRSHQRVEFKRSGSEMASSKEVVKITDQSESSPIRKGM